jgi:hypothetical protein
MFRLNFNPPAVRGTAGLIRSLQAKELAPQALSPAAARFKSKRHLRFNPMRNGTVRIEFADRF